VTARVDYFAAVDEGDADVHEAREREERVRSTCRFHVDEPEREDEPVNADDHARS
jgi:hypothetical protein